MDKIIEKYIQLPSSTTSRVALVVGTPLALITSWVAVRFSLLTLKYKLHNRKRPNVEGATRTLKDIPRLKATFPMVYWADENGLFEELIDQCFDAEGNAIPVAHHVCNSIWIDLM